MPLTSRLTLSSSAYAPLFALLGLVGWHDHPRLALAFFALAGTLAAALGLLIVYLREVLGTWPREVLSVEGRTEEIGAYTATYLLPFLAFAFDRWQTVLAIFLFIAFLVFVYVRARLPYLNPLLLLFGYRLVYLVHRDANSTDSRTAIAITNKKVSVGDPLELSYLQRLREGDVEVVLLRRV